MARLTKLEKEVVYKAVSLYDEIVSEGRESNITDDETKALATAHKKIRMELYGF